jgi:hypothetical protein
MAIIYVPSLEKVKVPELSMLVLYTKSLIYVSEATYPRNFYSHEKNGR